MCQFSRLPYVSKCCCFISLRLSAYLIGCLQSIFGLGMIVYALAYYFTKKDIDGQSAAHDSEHKHDDTVRTIYVCITGVAFILIGSLLIIGVKIKNVLLIRVYIVLEIIGLIVGFIVYIIILINLFLAFVIASADTSNFVGSLIQIFAISTAQVLVVVVVVVFAVIALKAYFLLCISSYLKELIKLESGTPLAIGYTAVAETDDNIKI